jgi:glycosyltransferase involved in cell wall biosynthesis
MKKLPKISAKCITYGRINTLEEAVQSFLLQEYEGEKEMIIVNDCPFQEIIFDHPEIKIFNFTETFTTIGDKENFAIENCSGDIIAVWDDDDIYLKHHMSNIAEWWKEDTNLLHWQRGVYYNFDNITSITAIGNCGIAYSKNAWYEIGKSPIENAGGDMTLVQRLHKLGNVVFASPEIPSCFYMWGGRSYHQSGQGHDIPGKENIIQRHSKYIETLRKQGKIPEGKIFLQPKWNIDYNKQLIDFLKK